MVSEYSEELPSNLFDEECFDEDGNFIKDEPDDDFDDPTYYEPSDWDERTERYWYPGPK